MLNKILNAIKIKRMIKRSERSISIKEKIAEIKKLEAKGYKTYLRHAPFIPDSNFKVIREEPVLQIINENTDFYRLVIEADDEIEYAKKHLENIIDITDKSMTEQVLIFNQRFIKYLRQDIALNKHYEDDNEGDLYWYIRSIGDEETYHGEPVTLQHCKSHDEAIIIAEHIYEKMNR